MQPRGKEIETVDAKLNHEKERFCSRLASIPGVRPLPSPQTGDWILLQVPAPADVARKVNRRIEPGTLSVPRTIAGTVRVHVADPKRNEAFLKTLREVVA
jgi:histidinol-phosphate/aromatic aminotransferase/cobyric acid decarboxylase-like protein